MKKFNKNSLSIALAVFSVVGFAGLTIAATTVNLGTAADFAILAGSTVTNTGPSVINGNLGLSPGTSVTGFPPGILNGTQHVANANALQAKNDLVTAYNNAAGQTPVSTVPTELGGTTKTPGIYNSAAGTFGITGTLTLDAAGDPNAVFIFKTASTLITAGSSNVVLANGAQACNIFWQVGSSATLGTNSTFKGNILALTSATLTTGANVEGRVFARNGAVTLDTNTITKATCAAIPPPTTATLNVIKKVVNTGGGTAAASAFTLSVKLSGTNVANSPSAGVVSPGKSYTLTAGTYVVSENANASYTRTFSGACNASGSVTLAAGNNKTCTVTNTFIPPPPATATLKVIKQVVNVGGGKKTASNFTLRVKNAGVDVDGSPAVGMVAPGRSYTLGAGTYVVSEAPHASYTKTYSGACNASGSVTLAAGDNKTCKIINTYVPVPKECKLEIQKQANKTTANPGEVILFTLNLKNIGNANCTGGGVRVIDDLNNEFNFIEGSESHSPNVKAGYVSDSTEEDSFSAPLYTPATGMLVWNADTLTPNEAGWVKFKVRVKQNVSCGNFQIPNRAKISATELSEFKVWVWSNIVKTSGQKVCS